MPSFDVTSPVTSAPIDRLALGVGWVRPGAGSIGGTINPSAASSSGWNWGRCFEGNEE
ncbi:MAG: hypothetical protein F2763_04270 [Actinobacteria bacterium]|uniref:Unannotated protein n=1 Tax=freshwater metagenome TaxID=449393 RepID=A0A6J7ADG1_9ZZZZ|nr:hypothetical protein [Actinomycetota bacterium]